MRPQAEKTLIWLVVSLTLIQPLSASACCCLCEAAHDDHTRNPNPRLLCVPSVDGSEHAPCTCPNTCRCNLPAASGHLVPATTVEQINRNKWYSQTALEDFGIHDFGLVLQRSTVTVWSNLCVVASSTCVELCRFQL